MSRTGRANRGKKPQNSGGTVGPGTSPAPSTDSQTPVFCFRHIVEGFDVEALDKDGRAAVAMTLQQRAQLTWSQIRQAPRHGAGTEWIPAASIKAPIPEQFQDQERFMVFRYNGKLPMVGVRTGATFHVVWIEAAFNSLYDHGS